MKLCCSAGHEMNTEKHSFLSGVSQFKKPGDRCGQETAYDVIDGTTYCGRVLQEAPFRGPEWKHVGDIFVFPRRDRFRLRMANPHDEPQNEEELSREYGQLDSEKSWKTPGGAKRVGRSIVRRIDWLEKVGIKFKEDEDGS